MKKILYGSFLSILVFALTTPVFAADLVSPSKEDGNVTIASESSFTNLYTAGGNVNINGDTKGDAVVAGGMVNLVGSVEQDFSAVGGTLNLSGDVYGDVRLAGGNININSNVLGDLVLAGANVNISEKASIGGDLVLAGGNVTVSAPVLGNIKAVGENLTLNSEVSGNVYVRSSQSLTFGPKAKVTGKVVYKGPKSAEVVSGASVGAIEYTQIAKKDFKNTLLFFATTAFLVQLVGWILSGLILMRLKRDMFLSVANSVATMSLSTLAWGALLVLGTPIAILLLFLTFVGYYVAFLLLAAYVLFLAVCSILSAISLGFLVLKFFNKQQVEFKDWQVVITGVVILSLLKFIPVIGWIVATILFLQTAGSLQQVLKK